MPRSTCRVPISLRLATPSEPGIATVRNRSGIVSFSTSNASTNIYNNSNTGSAVNALFAFGPDTPTADLHADDSQPIHIYAETGDILGLQFGEILTFNPLIAPVVTPSTWFIGAKSAEIQAGNDVISSGVPYTQTTGAISN